MQHHASPAQPVAAPREPIEVANKAAARPAMPIRRLFPVAGLSFFVSAAALAGCKTNTERFREGIDALAEKHRAALDQRKGALSVAQEAARKRPELTPIAGPLSPPGGSTFNIIMLSEDAHADRELARFEENTCAPTYRHGPVLALASGFRPTWGPGDNSLPPDEAEFERHEQQIEGVVAAPYALVCRATSVTAPVMVSDKEFEGGDYDGECRLFELATARYLGGFVVRANLNSSAKNVSSGLGELVDSVVDRELSPLGGVRDTFFNCSWKT